MEQNEAATTDTAEINIRYFPSEGGFQNEYSSMCSYCRLMEVDKAIATRVCFQKFRDAALVRSDVVPDGGRSQRNPMSIALGNARRLCAWRAWHDRLPPSVVKDPFLSTGAQSTTPSLSFTTASLLHILCSCSPHQCATAVKAFDLFQLFEYRCRNTTGLVSHPNHRRHGSPHYEASANCCVLQGTQQR